VVGHFQPRTNLFNLTHLVLRVALLPSVPSTHHTYRPSRPHSFIPGLKPSFSASPFHCSLPFLLQDELHRFLGLFAVYTSDHIPSLLFSFLSLSFSLFNCWFRAVGWLGSRVVNVLDSGAKGPGFKSQPRRCRVTVLGKLFTPIVPLVTKQQNW